MTNEELTAIRERAENSIGRDPDWDDFETLLAEVERLRGWLQRIADGPCAESHHRWAAKEALRGEDYHDEVIP